MIPGEVLKNRIKEIIADMEKTDGATEPVFGQVKGTLRSGVASGVYRVHARDECC